MRSATMNLNRQVIRLCKGILKAWEQWVDEIQEEEQEDPSKVTSSSEKEHKGSNRMTMRL